MVTVAKETRASPAALAWIEESKKLKRCPVYKCRRTYKSRHGLGMHLYQAHRMAELIAVILDLLGL